MAAGSAICVLDIFQLLSQRTHTLVSFQGVSQLMLGGDIDRGGKPKFRIADHVSRQNAKAHTGYRWKCKESW